VVVYNDWWWTASCEYSDIVYGVDSWLELRYPDMTASNTNPFVQMFPVEDPARVRHACPTTRPTSASRASSRTHRRHRFLDMWKFIEEGRADVYLQRMIDASPMLPGYRFEDLIAKAEDGTPALINSRTYPRVNGYEQVAESKPWHEDGPARDVPPRAEFIEAGENLIVHREPSDSTFYDPCAIVAAPHPAIRPRRPADWNIPADDRGHTARQMRNTTYSVDELLRTRHPLHAAGYTYVFHTPKYRHGAHTTPVDTDLMMTLFGPFGDIYRRDKRMPGTGEMYVDMNPADARAMGIEDGDYVWVDGDPEELPFRGWQDPAREAEYTWPGCWCARGTTRARRAASRACGSTATWRRRAA
jgi:nitrate reductase / nitrite oxidoreductase, alpha subunit